MQKNLPNGTLLYGYYVSFLKDIELKMVLNVWKQRKKYQKTNKQTYKKER